jgi:hypothetical protein
MLRSSHTVQPIAAIHALGYVEDVIEPTGGAFKKVGDVIVETAESLGEKIKHTAEDVGNAIKEAAEASIDWLQSLPRKALCGSGMCEIVLSNFLGTTPCGVTLRTACNAALDEFFGAGLIVCPLIVRAMEPVCAKVDPSEVKRNAGEYARQICNNIC